MSDLISTTGRSRSGSRPLVTLGFLGVYNTSPATPAGLRVRQHPFPHSVPPRAPDISPISFSPYPGNQVAMLAVGATIGSSPNLPPAPNITAKFWRSFTTDPNTLLSFPPPSMSDAFAEWIPHPIQVSAHDSPCSEAITPIASVWRSRPSGPRHHSHP